MAKARFAKTNIVYVSWARETEHLSWVERFRRKLQASQTCTLRSTGEGPAGDIKALGTVTDMVAVLTDKYLINNQRARDAAEAELAEFIKLKTADEGDKYCRRAYLAPLERCTFRRHRISDVGLDEQRVWLVRLREDGKVFASEPLTVADAEIYDAVEQIINGFD